MAEIPPRDNGLFFQEDKIRRVVNTTTGDSGWIEINLSAHHEEFVGEGELMRPAEAPYGDAEIQLEGRAQPHCCILL